MKLKPDCIRDVLLQVEKLHTITVREDGDVAFGALMIDDLYEALPKYNKEDIFYTVYNLGQAGLLDISLSHGDDSVTFCAITCITYDGHQLLEKIRDTKRWTLIRSILSPIRDYSLDAINQAANGAASGAITAALAQLGF